MFLIVLLAVVVVIVVLKVIISQKKKARAVAEEQRRKVEDESLVKELEPKAAAGDAAATKLLNYLRLRITQPFVNGSSRNIQYRGVKIGTVYSTAGNTLLQIIAEYDGWDDFSIENEKDSTNDPKYGRMVCYFTAPTGESCSVTWGYDDGSSFPNHPHDFISATIKLRKNSIGVEGILREFEQKMISFLKSQGASPASGPDFNHLIRFWNS